MSNDKQLQAIRELAVTVIELCGAAGPMGVPGGHLYTHMMSAMNLDQFESFMGTLVRLGKLRKSNECYHAI